MLSHGTYCRIETEAGGLSATPRQIIKATRNRLHADALGRDCRAARHAIYREMLRKFQETKDAAKRLRL
jgi:hypothetical protein